MKYAVISPRTPSPFPYCLSIVYPSSIHRLSIFGIPSVYPTGSKCIHKSLSIAYQPSYDRLSSAVISLVYLSGLSNWGSLDPVWCAQRYLTRGKARNFRKYQFWRGRNEKINTRAVTELPPTGVENSAIYFNTSAIFYPLHLLLKFLLCIDYRLWWCECHHLFLLLNRFHHQL